MRQKHLLCLIIPGGIFKYSCCTTQTFLLNSSYVHNREQKLLIGVENKHTFQLKNTHFCLKKERLICIEQRKATV